MAARKHHWVPQCYLRGFAVERKKGKHQVIAFDKVERRQFPASIADVAAERDFMAVDIVGHPPDAVETALAQFEDEFAVSLRNTFVAREFASDDDYNNILNFICLIHVRNPRMREMMRDFTERVGKGALSMMMATKERWDGHIRQVKKAGYLPADAETDYTKFQHLDLNHFRFETDTTTHISRELELFNSILPYFFERNWSILRAPPGRRRFSSQPITPPVSFIRSP
jgi:hypothetical protein